MITYFSSLIHNSMRVLICKNEQKQLYQLKLFDGSYSIDDEVWQFEITSIDAENLNHYMTLTALINLVENKFAPQIITPRTTWLRWKEVMTRC